MPTELSIAGKTIQHNTKRWESRRNRHTTTNGYDWGWIEGADGNITWSNENQFNEKAAAEACRIHNQWLSDQKPLKVKLMEAENKVTKCSTALDAACIAQAEAVKSLVEALAVVIAIQSQMKNEGIEHAH